VSLYKISDLTGIKIIENSSISRPQKEFGADLFALELLAPSCIVQHWKPEYIAKLCNIPKFHIKQVENFYTQEDFSRDLFAQKLFEQFQDFTRRYICQENQ
jgi:hypothetical protein